MVYISLELYSTCHRHMPNWAGTINQLQCRPVGRRWKPQAPYSYFSPLQTVNDVDDSSPPRKLVLAHFISLRLWKTKIRIYSPHIPLLGAYQGQCPSISRTTPIYFLSLILFGQSPFLFRRHLSATSRYYKILNIQVWKHVIFCFESF